MRAGLLLLACFATYPMAAQIETGSAFRVHVVNSVSGTPIAGANVVLIHEKGDRVWGRTDAGGVFTGFTHATGSHLLTVSRSGYRMAGAGGMGKTVEVRPGEATDARVEMLPLAVLAGRVLDQYGDPVFRAIVRTEDKLSLPGSDDDYDSSSSGTTDDRGEYRIAEVQPGKHFLAAEFSSTDKERRSGARARFRWPTTGGLVLYPNATGIDQAQQVEVAAGETKRLNDIHLPIQRAVTISGRIKPPPAEKGLSLSLERAAKLALHSPPRVQGGASEADGSFKMEALPGTYFLTASDINTGKISKPLRLEVGQKDITELEIELTSGYEINGRVVIDGRERLDFSKVLLHFGGRPVKMDGAGTFQTNLSGGKGMYFLQGLPEDWYVKKVEIAGRRIAGRQFEIDPGSTDMTLTFSPQGARVSIRLEGAVDGLATVYLVLLPETGAVPDVESVLQARRDESGTFTARAVPAGSYRVFTLDASNWVLLFRPDLLLEKYRTLAPLISVADGERKQLVLPVVKIQPE